MLKHSVWKRYSSERSGMADIFWFNGWDYIFMLRLKINPQFLWRTYKTCWRTGSWQCYLSPNVMSSIPTLATTMLWLVCFVVVVFLVFNIRFSASDHKYNENYHVRILTKDAIVKTFYLKMGFVYQSQTYRTQISIQIICLWIKEDIPITIDNLLTGKQNQTKSGMYD